MSNCFVKSRHHLRSHNLKGSLRVHISYVKTKLASPRETTEAIESELLVTKTISSLQNDCEVEREQNVLLLF